MHLSLQMECLLPVESTVQIGLENIWHEDIHEYQGKGKVIYSLESNFADLFNIVNINEDQHSRYSLQ